MSIIFVFKKAAYAVFTRENTELIKLACEYFNAKEKDLEYFFNSEKNKKDFFGSIKGELKKRQI